MIFVKKKFPDRSFWGKIITPKEWIEMGLLHKVQIDMFFKITAKYLDLGVFIKNEMVYVIYIGFWNFSWGN